MLFEALRRRRRRRRSYPHKAKIISSTKSVNVEHRPEVNLGNEEKNQNICSQCPCCGIQLLYEATACKFKCFICQVTIHRSMGNEIPSQNPMEVCSLSRLKDILKQCNETSSSDSASTTKVTKHQIFEPVCLYLRRCFSSRKILEESFLASESSNFINFKELAEFYTLIESLPSRRPTYVMICSSNDLLKRTNDLHNQSFKWLLILLMNPMLRICLKPSQEPKQHLDTPKIRAVSFEVTKRCVGYLTNMDDKTLDAMMHLLKYVKHAPFKQLVNFLNLYITFLLLRYYRASGFGGSTLDVQGIQPNVVRSHRNMETCARNTAVNNTSFQLHDITPTYDDAEISNNKSTSDDWTVRHGNIKVNDNKRFRFDPHLLQKDWHIRTATKLMYILYSANIRRGAGGQNIFKVPSRQTDNTRLGNEEFYNTMLDFLDFRKDFDIWRGMEPFGIIAVAGHTNQKYTTFCSYPFLLSLGVKISIMELEFRRIMEFNAEQAFLSSLDQRKVFDVYFRIRVRRDHIANDSLKAIKENQQDLLKSLRIEFIGEPGIDAGGPRKEWFLLLTKNLFSPLNGLFVILEESRHTWFSPAPLDIIHIDDSIGELYFLFGVVLGLAIFNSTILDLNLPKVFYKKLLKEPLTFNDYADLYPEAANNLLKMLDYEGDDFEEAFALRFETTYKRQSVDLIGKDLPHYAIAELVKGGSSIDITQQNKHQFTEKWINFYLNSLINWQFDNLRKGFEKVLAKCNAIALFNSQELEKLLCGDAHDSKYDFETLRSVTKYVGGFEPYSKQIQWLWEIIDEWEYPVQRKFLQFVTGSDRIPATGISTLNFKVSRLGALDSESLPISHTCFNELCLWEYESQEKLEQKLLLAIHESQGFALR